MRKKSREKQLFPFTPLTTDSEPDLPNPEGYTRSDLGV